MKLNKQNFWQQAKLYSNLLKTLKKGTSTALQTQQKGLPFLHPLHSIMEKYTANMVSMVKAVIPNTSLTSYLI